MQNIFSTTNLTLLVTSDLSQLIEPETGAMALKTNEPVHDTSANKQ